MCHQACRCEGGAVRWGVFWSQPHSFRAQPARFHFQKGPLTIGFISSGRAGGGGLPRWISGKSFTFSKMPSGCSVVPLSFHTLYLCPAYVNCRFTRSLYPHHMQCLVHTPVPFCHPPFEGKHRFQYCSIEEESYRATDTLLQDIVLFFWPQNWFSNFNFLEEIWSWKHKRPSNPRSDFSDLDKDGQTCRIIICLNSSQQLLCRQNALKYVYKIFNINTRQMETLSNSVCTQELDKRSWKI